MLRNLLAKILKHAKYQVFLIQNSNTLSSIILAMYNGSVVEPALGCLEIITFEIIKSLKRKWKSAVKFSVERSDK